MSIDQNEALTELARIWDDDASRVRRYDPSDPKARVLAACAEELRKVLGETAPEWVSVSAVQSWTGWSRQTLVKRCREELFPRQEARKVRGGWEIQLEAALRWPRRKATDDDTTDLAELARMVGRAG